MAASAAEAQFWKGAEGLVDVLYEAVTRMILVFRVLSHMKDLLGTAFPAPALLLSFWRSMTQGLEQELKVAVKSRTWRGVA